MTVKTSSTNGTRLGGNHVAQVIVGCVLAFFGHPYIGVLIAAIHF